MGRKIAIYTAVCNGYDTVYPPVKNTPDADFICFTDNKRSCSGAWIPRSFPKEIGTYRPDKIVKIMPHLVLPEYEVSVWVDANFIIKADLGAFIMKRLEDKDLCFFMHPNKRENVESEVKACIRFKKDKEEILNAQLEKYKSLGINHEILAGGIIFRRHNKYEVISAMNTWAKEIADYSIRDQVSLPYVLQTTGIPYNKIELKISDNYWFYKIPHNKKSWRN